MFWRGTPSTIQELNSFLRSSTSATLNGPSLVGRLDVEDGVDEVGGEVEDAAGREEEPRVLPADPLTDGEDVVVE